MSDFVKVCSIKTQQMLYQVSHTGVCEAGAEAREGGSIWVVASLIEART